MKSLGPYLPLYVDDLVGGTAEMGADEFGAYLRLLIHQWRRGSVEHDQLVIERITGCEYGRLRRVLAKFENRDGALVNLRMEQVRQEREAYIETRRAAAQKGWEGGKGEDRRMRKHMHTHMRTDMHTGMHRGMHSERNPSPSPSSSSSPLSLPARAPLQGGVGGLAEKIIACRTEFAALHPDAVLNELRCADPETMAEHVEQFVRDAANMLEPPKNPIGLLRGYLRGKPKKPATAKTWDATI